MRIASFPTVRIALLGFVGYQLFRRRNPNVPEALLKRADEMAWLNNLIGAARSDGAHRGVAGRVMREFPSLILA